MVLNDVLLLQFKVVVQFRGDHIVKLSLTSSPCFEPGKNHSPFLPNPEFLFYIFYCYGALQLKHVPCSMQQVTLNPMRNQGYIRKGERSDEPRSNSRLIHVS